MSRSTSAIEQEVADLERRLHEAKHRLQTQRPDKRAPLVNPTVDLNSSLYQVPAHHLHNLLLLSDSALPLGSFAFSSGLESFLAHRPKRTHTVASFKQFLALSLASLASTALPYVLTAYRHPHLLPELDNDFDASTNCVVARRASVKQGRALVAVWERSFRPHAVNLNHEANGVNPTPEYNWDEASELMATFCAALKTADEADVTSPNGHLAPLFGVVCAMLDVPLAHVLYLFLMNHAKTIVSAGIRSSVLGPYQAQALLAGHDLKDKISRLVDDELHQATDESTMTDLKHRANTAGQSVPLLDLWGGRHEIIYSRIFNS